MAEVTRVTLPYVNGQGCNKIITWPDCKQISAGFMASGEMHDIWFINADGSSVHFTTPFDDLSMFECMFKE